MASRIKQGEEKMLPNLTFKMRLNIPFTVSCGKIMTINFTTLCGNEDNTISQKLRKFNFEELKCKDQADFDKLFRELSRYVGEKIKDKMKEINNYQGSDWYSKMIRKRIEEELKNEKN